MAGGLSYTSRYIVARYIPSAGPAVKPRMRIVFGSRLGMTSPRSFSDGITLKPRRRWPV